MIPLTDVAPFEAAKAYTNRGCRVIPVDEGKKTPSVPGWQRRGFPGPSGIGEPNSDTWGADSLPHSGHRSGVARRSWRQMCWASERCRPDT